METISVSDHLIQRAAQRNLSPRDIAFVLRYGRLIHRTGIEFYFLGWRDIPEDQRQMDYVSRLEGLTVLMGRDQTLITAYKDPKAIRKIKRKSKQGFERIAA